MMTARENLQCDYRTLRSQVYFNFIHSSQTRNGAEHTTESYRPPRDRDWVNSLSIGVYVAGTWSISFNGARIACQM